MTTLEEHNAGRMALYNAKRESTPNGIDCPFCGGELMDTDPNATLTTNPPQKRIFCQDCEFKGYRLA